MFKDFFTDAYAENIRKKWEIFQEKGKVSGLRRVILESWKRCRDNGVSVEQIHHTRLPQTKFVEVQEKERGLVEVATAILERIFYTIRSHECLINLANAEGVALRVWHGSGNSFGLDAGTLISELGIGTAGMPLCLKNREPIIVYGAEHYCIPHHDMVCVSSPILSHEGQLLGGLTISCNRDIFHPWSFTLVTEAATSISEQLRLRELLARENAMVEAFPDALALVDGEGRITRANNMASNLLGLDEKRHIHLNTILGNRVLLSHIREGRSLENEETRFKGPAVHLSRGITSFKPLDSGGILTIKNAPEMYSYAARTAGIEARYVFEDIIGESGSIFQTIARARKYAMGDLPVLILGESGTGKELFAQAIHNASPRHNQPFVVVNCGALPRELVQSELFGYVEGAFTGARKHGNPGKFELADNGTIFLDEIGEMEPQSQVALLRLLQSGEITRIGGSASRRVNVRILAATNRDLNRSIAEGRFREDLYHRLNVFSLQIPSLRERSEDIPVLIKFFLKKLAAKYPQFRTFSFTSAAMRAMMKRKWMGNVRELEHFMEKLLFTAKGEKIDIQDISAEASSRHEDSLHNYESEQTDKDYRLLVNLLIQFNGNVKAVADYLGLGKTTLYTKLNVYGIVPKRYRKLTIK